MKTKTVKTTFSAGEISSDLLGRGDLRAYENGAGKLRNVFIKPTGGISRRAGLKHIAQVAGNGRLISFEFNTTQTYLLVITNLQIAIYMDGIVQTTISAPWIENDIKQIAWMQSADTLLLIHPDYPPKKLTRNGMGVWSINDWEFYTKDNRVMQPMYKFAATGVTLTPSATSGTITVTASSNVFVSGHVGTRMRISNKEILVTAVNSPTVITANVVQTLISTVATIDWEEQAFSSVRGYPVTATFHQDRLVIGGSRDLPNRIWMSQSGDLFNFDLGTGLDSESIEFGVFSDQINAIRGVFSGRHLQVFTSGAEWMVTGDPLTPANVQIKRQTRVGSNVSRYIPPIDVDGATLFIARNGKEIREFVYTDVEQAYRATDLAIVSQHIISDPIDHDFDQRRRLLFLIRGDGSFVTLTVYRAEEVTAWTVHETAGLVKSVAVVGDTVMLMVERDGVFYIEQVSDEILLDAALSGEVETATSTWIGLSHLNGCEVSIIADGVIKPSQTVVDGIINLDTPANSLIVGLPYTHIIEPLPPANISDIGGASSVRLIDVSFRVKDTAALQLDVGRGLKDISLRKIGEAQILDAPPPIINGDIKVGAYGWRSDTSKPLWRIEQSLPLNFTLLSVTSNIMAN